MLLAVTTRPQEPFTQVYFTLLQSAYYTGFLEDLYKFCIFVLYKLNSSLRD